MQRARRAKRAAWEDSKGPRAFLARSDIVRVVKRVPPALVALALIFAGCDTEEPPAPLASESDTEPSEGQAIEPPALGDADGDGEAASEDEEAEPTRAACVVPAIPIPRPRECVRGRGYPACKWQMPHATLSDGRYRRWRNTIMEHWWGRPALVSFVMAAADRYRLRFPDQVLAVGDLDAPGPRHQTHDNGVDVDIYLPGAMLVENAGGGRYPSNHEGKSPAEIEETRQRVEGLARVLAECAEGAVRIYYNDDVVLERFHQWYDAQGFPPNPFGRPMQKHNSLHDFHFHISIPEDLPVLERAPLDEDQYDPIQVIEEPPDPNSAPNLASRNRHTTWRAEMDGAANAEAAEGDGNGGAPEAPARQPRAHPTAMTPTPNEGAPGPTENAPPPTTVEAGVREAAEPNG